jgi:hypothetical protein
MTFFVSWTISFMFGPCDKIRTTPGFQKIGFYGPDQLNGFQRKIVALKLFQLLPYLRNVALFSDESGQTNATILNAT